MSFKETSGRIKQIVTDLTSDVRGVSHNFTKSVPRPLVDRLAERDTMILRQPLLKTLRERRRE